MTIKRLDHVSVVTEDLEATRASIVALAEELLRNNDKYLLTNDKRVK
jgi:hypothetical protein